MLAEVASSRMRFRIDRSYNVGRKMLSSISSSSRILREALRLHGLREVCDSGSVARLLGNAWARESVELVSFRNLNGPAQLSEDFQILDSR